MSDTNPGLERAISIAALAHAGQVDKAGQPYILHPLRVMMRLSAPNMRIAAVLHDVVEDTTVTLDQIRDAFGDTIADAVDALSRREGEGYPAFIERCADNTVARAVKMADLADNMDLARLGRDPTTADAKRQEKYATALGILAERSRASCDSGSDPQGENSRSEVECEASQSGGAEGAASPTPSSRNPETPNDR